MLLSTKVTCALLSSCAWQKWRDRGGRCIGENITDGVFNNMDMAMAMDMDMDMDVDVDTDVDMD
eukprot:932064-Prymnesium_polylepis.4